MDKHLALKIILVIALGGAIFSGTLTYQELFTKTIAQCSALGKPGTILGYPACVYGFFFFTVVSVVAGLGVMKKK